MRIEAIGNVISSIGAALGGAAGSVGRGAEAGPSVGPIFSAPAMEAGGSVGFGPGFLEATVPYTPNFNPTGEILFNPFPRELAELLPAPNVDIIAEAGEVAVQAWSSPLPEQAVPEMGFGLDLIKPNTAIEANYLPRAAYWFADVESPVIKYGVVTMPESKVAAQLLKKGQVLEEAEAVAAKAWEENVITQAEKVVEVSGGLQPKTDGKEREEVEEIVKEEVVVEKPGDVIEEEKVVKRKKYLVDYPVLAQVLFEVKEAYEKGEKEAKRLGKKLFGPMFARLLPGQHEGNTGGAVKPHGMDGTIAARREAIAAIKEVGSLEEVKPTVFANRPVTIGEEGEQARQEEVDTTYRYYIVKPFRAVEVVQKRIKKKVPVSDGQVATPFVAGKETGNKQETSLKDFPVLTGVFQKAA